MQRDRAIAIGFIVAAILAVGGFFIFDKVTEKNTAGAGAAGPHPLATNQDVGVLYKLDKQTQDTLVQAVEHFCVKAYERNSCIKHLSTCGKPCFVVIPKEQRAKVFADYQALRKERGLVPLLEIPKKTDDD